MLGKIMIPILDHSKAAKLVDWMCPALYYTEVGRCRYQLEKDWWVLTKMRNKAFELRFPSGRLKTSLDSRGLLLVKAGEVWDGPSGPTYNTKDSMAGSLAHDMLYAAGREGHLSLSDREAADKEALRIWLASGMYEWRAKLWYDMLRKFAGFAYRPQHKGYVEIKL